MKEIERLIKKCDECKLNECINCEISYTDIQTIKHLIQAYKDLEEIEESHRKENGELREKIKELEERLDETLNANLALAQGNADSIPVSLVEEKIEELKSKSGGNVFHIQQTINAEIRLLEELLERRK